MECGHETGVVKPGTTQRVVLNAVFVYIYYVMYVHALLPKNDRRIYS
jgi:hypothetical protein